MIRSHRKIDILMRLSIIAHQQIDNLVKDRKGLHVVVMNSATPWSEHIAQDFLCPKQWRMEKDRQNLIPISHRTHGNMSVPFQPCRELVSVTLAGTRRNRYASKYSRRKAHIWSTSIQAIEANAVHGDASSRVTGLIIKDHPDVPDRTRAVLLFSKSKSADTYLRSHFKTCSQPLQSCVLHAIEKIFNHD